MSARHGRRLTLLVALALALTLAGGVRAGGGGTNVPSTPTTGMLRICNGCANYGLSEANQYSYVVLNSWQAGLIPQLKSQNPNLKVLVYKDIAATLSYDCTNGVDNAQLPAGVGYCWADQHHPDWFLTDTNGARIEFCDFSGAWQMDVGSAAYQEQWLNNVLADLRSAPWDGVMLDDVNESETWHLCGRTIARYPGSGQYGAATESFLSQVGPGLRSAGYLAMPNISLDDTWSAGGLARWDRWVSYSSGAVQEYFSKWGRDSSRWLTDDGTRNDWSIRQALFARTEAAGKTFLGITYAPSGDAHSMRYARASFLLDWTGGTSALVYEPTTPEAQDPYAPDWTIDLGTPTEPRARVGVAWLRLFSGGAVVLNPSPTSSQTVPLGGNYVLPDGTIGSTVTVAPTDAVLLSAAQVPPPPAPPPPPPGNLPVNTQLPTISVIRRSRALSASQGTWIGSPTSFAYQWLRCDSSGNGCSALAGVSSRTYNLATDDIGSRLRVAVTATNASGSTTATSEPSVVVTRVNGRAFALLRTARIVHRADRHLRRRLLRRH